MSENTADLPVQATEQQSVRTKQPASAEKESGKEAITRRELFHNRINPVRKRIDASLEETVKVDRLRNGPLEISRRQLLKNAAGWWVGARALNLLDFLWRSSKPKLAPQKEKNPIKNSPPAPKPE